MTRAHVIAWRDELAGCELSATTIWHRLSALASLFDYLCDQNAVTHNPTRSRRSAILAMLLYHALCRDELCKLKVKDYRQERRGVPHLKVSDKNGKTDTCPFTRPRTG